MKKALILLALIALKSAGDANAQTPDNTNKSFEELKKKDFTRLIGVDQNFEGVTIKYDKDKANLNFGQGISLSPSSILNASAGVGTSNDITTLFNQNLLPTFAASASFNHYIYLQYYYDGAYENNYNALKGDAPVNTIHTDYRDLFDYKNHIRENIRKGTYNEKGPAYTFKEVYWWSLKARYNNDKYGFFDDQRAFKSQQYDTAFQTFTVQASVSGYMGWNNSDYEWKPYAPEYLFVTLYGFGSKNNNISDPQKVTVSEVKEVIVDPVSNTTKQVMGKSENYYKGKYQEYFNLGIGGKLFFSPVKMLTLSVFGEYRFIKKTDRTELNLNNNGWYGAGLYLYTGSTSKSNINIGFNYKRVQSATDSKWSDKLEFATSIPISLFD